MTNDLRKLLLSECRCVTYQPADREVTEEALTGAMTVNGNLLTLGYTLKPADVALLSVSPSLDTFYEDVRSLMGDVAAEPMYPDFPRQVMEMDEAKFRFQQMLHYFSTYGIEELFGEKVKKGWLPYEGQGTPKTQSDEVLLAAKALELLPEDDAAFLAAARILKRRERMTLPEKELVMLAFSEIAPERLSELSVAFKENLTGLFAAVMETGKKDQAQQILRALCKHTGDIFKCMDYVLIKNRYHLRTSQKRFLVKLLESYPAEDLKTNVILSQKKAKHCLLALQYLDYNLYSKSPAHKEAVRAFRNGELSSWEGQARYLLEHKSRDALAFAAKRPGMLLRMAAWAARLGYRIRDIRDALRPHAGELSTQTLLKCTQAFAERSEQKDRFLYGMFWELLQENLKQKDTLLRGKKVFLDMEDFDLEYSEILTNDKSEEGGYVRSGMAFRIPKEVRYLRMFVYWNDWDCVDLDLHAAAVDGRGYRRHVGWDAQYKSDGIVHSGDITYSDAAEYIDIDLESPFQIAGFTIDIYDGKRNFKEIETCYVGIMAVSKLNEEVKLYDPANCFFTHELRGSARRMSYGYIDIKRRILVPEIRDLKGKSYYQLDQRKPKGENLKTYLDLLLAGQEVILVTEKNQAEIVLKMGKAEEEKDVSFLDHNLFMD